jgi:hypothetical protein
MRTVTAATVLFLAAATVTTVIAWMSREGAVEREQARVEHAELMRHRVRLEQMFAGSLNRSPSTGAAEANAVSQGVQTPTTQQQRSADTPVETVALTLEQRAAHEKALREGNAIVDRAIAAGHWDLAQFTAFGTATQALSAHDRADMLARVSAAINNGQVHFDPRR